jgi:hypothetical protein
VYVSTDGGASWSSVALSTSTTTSSTGITDDDGLKRTQFRNQCWFS